MYNFLACIVLGDFNLPDIDWDSNVFTPCGRYPSPIKAMMEIALDFNLQQVVLKPTRDNSILDLCFTNSPAFVDSIEIKPGISDHDVVVVTASIRPKIVKLPKRKVYLYNRADFNSISTKLEDLNHQLDEDSVKNMDIDKLWDTLTNTIQLASGVNPFWGVGGMIAEIFRASMHTHTETHYTTHARKHAHTHTHTHTHTQRRRSIFRIRGQNI